MRLPILCLVTDLQVIGNDTHKLVQIMNAAVSGGVNMVQIRAPQMSDDQFWDFVRFTRIDSSEKTLKIVNPSRIQLRKIDDCIGVQLSENAAVSVETAREIMGANALIGRSVHSARGAEDAQEEGADFIVLGTIFPTASHPNAQTHGMGIIRETRARIGIPIIAIGGINERNAGEAIRNGASGVAVMRSILGAADPCAASERIWREISAAYAYDAS